jgi:hypothetical protein
MRADTRTDYSSEDESMPDNLRRDAARRNATSLCDRPLHFVSKRYDATLIALHLEQMERHLLAQSFEEGDALSNQDGENGIANFICQAEAKALARYRTAADKPDIPEVRL